MGLTNKDFTRSQDRRLRANVHVRFRVGLDALKAGAADLVWKEMVDEAEQIGSHLSDDEIRELAERLARTLTRAKVREAARAMLSSYGYSFGEAMAVDDYTDAAWDAVEPRVDALWPDLAAAEPRREER
jgi:hypothetical protein